MTLWKKCELRTYSRVLALLLGMILLLSTGVFQPTASAEESQEVWNPDSYEIHLMLDSDLVLDENHLLKQEYLDLFEVDDRLRLKYEEDAEKDFKLTYKKRYSVPENDLTAAVHLAETEGFDLLSGLWEPQIDWGYTGMTLSLSAEAAVPTGGKKTIADLNPEDGLAMMLENMPEQEQDWKGEHRGSDLFESAVMVGPIFFRKRLKTGRW